MADPTILLEVEAPSTIDSITYLVIGSGSTIGTSQVAPTVVWDDRISEAREFSISRGAGQSGMVWTADAGTATVLFDNRDRTYDQTSNTDVRPGRAIRVRVTWNATTYSLFRGTVDQWAQDYPGFAKDATTEASCSDGTGLLANAALKGRTPAEKTGSRIARLADAAEWPSSRRNIDAGVTDMPAGPATSSALDAMLLAAVTEFGELYVEGDGDLRFRDRDTLWTASRTRTSQATFGDGVGELKFAELEPDQVEASDVRNRISIKWNEQNGQVTKSDSASIGDWGVHEDSVDVSMTTENDAERYATFLLSQFADPQFSFGSITIIPKRDPSNLWPQALGRELGDRITVKLTPPGGGARIVRDVFIRSIEHSVRPGLDWVTTFGVQDASSWPDVFVIGTHNVGDMTNKIGW
jgi:hypothetical protein